MTKKLYYWLAALAVAGGVALWYLGIRRRPYSIGADLAASLITYGQSLTTAIPGVKDRLSGNVFPSWDAFQKDAAKRGFDPALWKTYVVEKS